MSVDRLSSLIDLYSKASKKADSEFSSGRDLEIIKALMERKQAKENISDEERQELLNRRYQSFTQKESFKPGDKVRWKQGLKNKGGLKYSDTAIVIEVLENPLYDAEKDSGSPYFREPFDMIIAFLDDDNDFIALHVDSRRFQHDTP